MNMNLDLDFETIESDAKPFQDRAFAEMYCVGRKYPDTAIDFKGMFKMFLRRNTRPVISK
jgi:hypothetical protein